MSFPSIQLWVDRRGTDSYISNKFANLCNKHNYAIIASHRSGDTVDRHLAHIAIGSGSVMMKSGVVGGERISKLNELIRIEETNFINNNMSMPIARVKKYVS